MPWPTRVKCEDLDTGKVRYGRTGFFFAYKFFIFLLRGHTYEITATEYDVKASIELINFWNYVDLKLFEANP